MGFTDSKPFSRAGQFRLVAMLTAAVFCLCAKSVWHQSTLLSYARGETTLNQAFNPANQRVPTHTASHSLESGAVEMDFSDMAPPMLWLIELSPNTWTLTFENPEAELIPGSAFADVDLSTTRSMGPFQASIWTTPLMGRWASTSNKLDHKLNWWGNEQHGLTLPEIRTIIATQWTTGGQSAIDTFATSTASDPAFSFSTQMSGWALNSVSISALLATFTFSFASFLVSNRDKLQTYSAQPMTPHATSLKDHPQRDAA